MNDNPYNMSDKKYNTVLNNQYDALKNVDKSKYLKTRIDYGKKRFLQPRRSHKTEYIDYDSMVRDHVNSDRMPKMTLTDKGHIMRDLKRRISSKEN